MDREKVIKGLEIQLDDLQKYADSDEILTLTQEQAKEIVALLKEQEGQKMSDSIVQKELIWHNLKVCPNDIPKIGLWFLCKIKGSDDLKLVCGFEKVTFDKYDGWAKVECPY